MRTGLVIAALLTCCVGYERPLSADERIAALYYEGLTDITATLPRSDLAIPSTAMPCANCHGADGQGGREGGVAVPPISWRRLAMATTERPAYDQAMLARALRDGISADGAPLHEIMPRYALTDALIRELSDWLLAIGPARTPGLSDEEIAIAIPSTTTDDPRARVIASVLRLYAERLNRHGGVYGRTLRLIEGETDDAFVQLAAVEPQTNSGDAALNLWPLHTRAEGNTAFHLIPSDDRLMRSLLDDAKRDDPDAQQLSEIDDKSPLPRTLVFDGEEEMLSAFIRNWKGPAALTIYTTTEHVDLAALRNLSPRPLRLVLANSLAPGKASDSPEKASHVADFQKVIGELQLPRMAQPLAKAAWVAASLLEDALRATGRTLDQERFKAAITSMPPFESGLLPPVHPTRGLTSIGLVSFDLAANEVTRRALALD